MRFLLLLLSPLSLLSQSPSSMDVQHYRFHIELNDINDTIYAKAEIRVKFLRPSTMVELDLVKGTNGNKGMIVTGVTGKQLRGFTHDPASNKLQLNLLQNTVKNDTATFTIAYKGIPADGLIISKNKYGHRTFFADNWPDRGHHWLPLNDHPADKATVEFIVMAPRHYQVVANGIQVEESDLPSEKKLTHWREDIPISSKVMVIGVADFAVQLAGNINGCIPVYSWVYPEDRDKGFFDYAQAAEILPYYIKQVGPYAYKKLANVQSRTKFGGLENANTIFYSENSVSGTRRSETLLAHEIAHQWFGNMATEKTFAHLWLSEGFATYMTILYMENKYGADTALYMIREDREQVIGFARTSNRPVVDSNETDYMALLNANSYQKGGWILHMLRRELGDSIFWRAIRNYYAKYAGTIAGTDDLRKVFEEVSGKSLEKFFRQWLYSPGIPRLQVSWKYQAKKQVIEITVEQLQQGLFQFPLEVGIVSTSPAIHKLLISERKKTYTIPARGKVFNLSIDPRVSLLAEMELKELK